MNDQQDNIASRMIRLERVSKTYRTARGVVDALREVTLSIDAGDFVAVRGPSGCGKSTLLAMVGGLARPSSGTVEVAGQDISRMSATDRARFRAEHVGFVFQMFHLLPYLSVVDNVALAAEASVRTEARNRAEGLLDKFHLDQRKLHRPAELSAGERQRVAMARALLNKPRLLLADEPTGNLDPQNASILLDLLSEFHGSGGTILLVTHDQQAADRAGRTIHLHEGRIESS